MYFGAQLVIHLNGQSITNRAWGRAGIGLTITRSILVLEI